MWKPVRFRESPKSLYKKLEDLRVIDTFLIFIKILSIIFKVQRRVLLFYDKFYGETM